MILPKRFLFAALLLLLLPLATVGAQDGEENRAALVIRSGDDQIETYCVGFVEPEISGYELLQRAGREVLANEAGMGVTVCSLDGIGCPAGNCFCQCKGDPCVYWSYWHRPDGEWQYAVIGASTYMVQPGAVEGWSWGPGSVTEAIAPPPLSFADVCSPGEVTAEGETAAVVEASATPVEPVPSLAAPTAAAPAVTVANTDTPSSAATPVWLYGLFAAIVLGLAAFLLWLQRREGAT